MATTIRKLTPRSRVYKERQVTFMSYDAQLILRDFARLAFSMYRLGVSLRFFMSDDEVDALYETVYEELIEPLKKDIADELQRVEVMCKANGVGLMENYSYPVNRPIRIFMPDAEDILNVAQSLDTLICRLNDLWFAREIKHRDYVRTKEKYGKALLKTSNRITSLAATTMDRAKKDLEKKQGAPHKESEEQVTDARPIMKVATASS
jgi:hypothetical protein